MFSSPFTFDRPSGLGWLTSRPDPSTRVNATHVSGCVPVIHNLPFLEIGLALDGDFAGGLEGARLQTFTCLGTLERSSTRSCRPQSEPTARCCPGQSPKSLGCEKVGPEYWVDAGFGAFRRSDPGVLSAFRILKAVWRMTASVRGEKVFSGSNARHVDASRAKALLTAVAIAQGSLFRAAHWKRAGKAPPLVADYPTGRRGLTTHHPT